MSQLFELVIYTAGVQDYTDKVLRNIDPKNRIKYRLYREHCTILNKSYFLKNLRLIGRNLKQTILVDVLLFLLRITRCQEWWTFRYSTRSSHFMVIQKTESCSDWFSFWNWWHSRIPLIVFWRRESSFKWKIQDLCVSSIIILMLKSYQWPINQHNSPLLVDRRTLQFS